MKAIGSYAYMQTRVQLRHGLRPQAAVWQQLAGQRDLGGYLQLARRTALRPWVLGLHSTDAPHRLESILVRQFHDYVQQSTWWLARPWRQSILWVQCLVDLPVVQFLLQGNTVPRWMLEDPRLKNFTVIDHKQRLQTLQLSIYAPLVDAWQQHTPLLAAWLEHWQRLWPRRAPGGYAELQQVLDMLIRHQVAFAQLPASRGWPERDTLRRRLEYLFRRCSFHPAALFVHLALVALDCERLRGDVMHRCLFPGPGELTP